MAHRNMVGGTAYDTSGGRVMVDGTVYGVDKGKTMVDGTAVVITFSVPVVVEISGDGNFSYGCVIINGTRYSKEATVEVNVGDTITLYNSPNSLLGDDGYIYVDGSRVATATKKNSVSYPFVVQPGTNKIRIYLEQTDDGSDYNETFDIWLYTS